MRTLQLLMSGAALAGLSLIASAQEYPAKPIRVITPYGAGGASDIVVRAGVHEMSKQLGQAIIVENRTGAGATIGFEAFAASPPDGYTLLGTASSLHGIAAALYTKTLKHDPNKDVEPIIVFANVSNVLVVNPSVNAKSMKDLIELAKTQPGKLTFVSAGVGTSVHMAGELFKNMAGVQMTHVPYKSSVAALVDLMAGRVDVMFDNIETPYRSRMALVLSASAEVVTRSWSNARDRNASTSSSDDPASRPSPPAASRTAAQSVYVARSVEAGSVPSASS